MRWRILLVAVLALGAVACGDARSHKDPKPWKHCADGTYQQVCPKKTGPVRY